MDTYTYRCETLIIMGEVDNERVEEELKKLERRDMEGTAERKEKREDNVIIF